MSGGPAAPTRSLSPAEQAAIADITAHGDALLAELATCAKEHGGGRSWSLFEHARMHVEQAVALGLYGVVG